MWSASHLQHSPIMKALLMKHSLISLGLVVLNEEPHKFHLYCFSMCTGKVRWSLQGCCALALMHTKSLTGRAVLNYAIDFPRRHFYREIRGFCFRLPIHFFLPPTPGGELLKRRCSKPDTCFVNCECSNTSWTMIRSEWDTAACSTWLRVCPCALQIMGWQISKRHMQLAQTSSMMTTRCSPPSSPGLSSRQISRVEPLLGLDGFL